MSEHNKTYIIVEDSYFSQVFLSRSVTRIRPDLILMGTADETSGMNELLASHRIDLIIARDVVSDGNVVEALREKDVRIPVILISQFAERAVFGQGVNMIRFILEPVSVSELSDALNRIGAEPPF